MQTLNSYNNGESELPLFKEITMGDNNRPIHIHHWIHVALMLCLITTVWHINFGLLWLAYGIDLDLEIYSYCLLMIHCKLIAMCWSIIYNANVKLVSSVYIESI